VQRVLGQIQELDSSLSRAIDAYNSANERLGQIQEDLRSNTRYLALARRNLRRSEQSLSARVVTLYTADETTSLGLLLGATSLDDFLNRIETVDRVSEQDVFVHRETFALRREVKRRQIRLKHARGEQRRVVAERASHRQAVESQLSERRALADSIRSEIERLRAAERRRQVELARQARARLAAQAASRELMSAAAQAVTESAQDASVQTQAAPAEPALAAAPPGRYGGVVGIAMQYLGTPYLWGGASPSGFDCSGFIMYVYAKMGVSLPHNAAAQYGYGTPVARSDLQPGDLVFFNGLGHNGIYIGGGQFIHSPHSGDVVKISAISGWYSSTWVGARRL